MGIPSTDVQLTMASPDDTDITSSDTDSSKYYQQDDFTKLKCTQGIKVFHLNTRSCLHKMDEISRITVNCNIDVLSVNESMLSCDIQDNEIFIDNYYIFR